jgi:Protein of unknown function (DUF3237)
VSLSEPATNFPLGLRGNGVPTGQVAPALSTRCARDGSVLWWGEADTPTPPPVISPGATASVTVAVSPVRPGHAVTVEYRVNGGPVRQAIGLPEPRAYDANARIFRAVLPGQPGGLVEFLPVLRFAGHPISPCLEESAKPPQYQVGRAAVPVETGDLSTPPSATFAASPCRAWGTHFLGSLTTTVHKEVVGVTPDGLRIDWHVKEGSIVGPGFHGVVLPGATDWMRIRSDGVGIVNVQACFETRTGARIYSSYGGMVDLGPDGYARALRGEFTPLPPVVVTPTYATADKRLEWLNRAQCIGVGRVDTTALRVELDVYVVQVGGRKHAE